MSTAAAAVLSTPELLEAIILELPNTQVFLIQRVNKTFRDVIRGSPSLQKALFLRPTADYVLQLHNNRRCFVVPCSSRADCDPELSEKYTPKAAGPYQERIDRWVIDASDRQQHTVVLNPSLVGDFNGFAAKKGITLDSTRANMLLTQPPVGSLIVDHKFAHHFHVSRASDPKRGLTVGEFEASIRAFTGQMIVLFITEWQEVPKGSTASDILEMFGKAAVTVEGTSNAANGVKEEERMEV